jgi:hypothetical protein
MVLNWNVDRKPRAKPYFYTSNELSVFIQQKLLEQFNYINKKDGTITKKGKLLLNTSSHEFVEYMLLFVELLESNYLFSIFDTNLDILTKYSNHENKNENDDQEKKRLSIEQENNLILLSRVLSLIPLSFKLKTPIGWNGLIRKDLASFYSLVKILRNNLWNLQECIFTASCLDHRIMIQNNKKENLKNKIVINREEENELEMIYHDEVNLFISQVKSNFIFNEFNNNCNTGMGNLIYYLFESHLKNNQNILKFVLNNRINILYLKQNNINEMNKTLLSQKEFHID